MPANPLPRRPPSPPGSGPGGPDAPPPAPLPVQALASRQVEPPGVRRNKWIKRGIGGGLALLVLAPIAYFIAIYDPPCEYPPPRPRPAYEVPFQEAKNLIREGKWAEAQARLLQARQLAPDEPVLDDYLKAVERELPNEQHLTAAREALTEGRLAKAKAELDAIRQDTAMYEQVAALRRKLLDAADEKAGQAQLLLDSQQWHQALLLAQEVLAVAPEQRVALKIQEQARPLIVELRPPAPTPVTARFMQGDLPDALKLARACAPQSRPCKAELKALTEFSRLYNKQEKLGTQGLVRLFALDKELIGAQSPSPLAAKLRVDLRNKAKDLYLHAYATKDVQPRQSLQKFRQVMELLLPDDELYLKARNWASALQP